MKFRFPFFIIDEDYRSDNASGLGVRTLSTTVEAEGMEVIGVTSYGDLSTFAQQQSRASTFALSIDDEEFDDAYPESVAAAIKNMRSFTCELRFRNTLLTALLQFNDDYDRNQPMWRILPAPCRPRPLGIPLLIPSERFNWSTAQYLQFARAFNAQFPGFEMLIHGLSEVSLPNRKRYHYVDCLKASTEAPSVNRLRPAA